MKINVEGVEIDFNDKVIEVLKTEPDDVYERFIKNFSLTWEEELTYMKENKNSSLFDFFREMSYMGFFVWENTPEGFDYWNKISLKML